MKSITHTFEKINDSLNPIVVKELKQAVQGKFLIVVLMLLLVVQLFTMGVFLANKSASLSFDIGRTIFTVLLGILSATCLLFVPAYTGIRLASERSDANVDLLFITTLRPRSIIWGKLLAALILTVLLYSACMPFMTFTYLLRGIDLPSIFILLAFNFIIIATGIQSAILIGCIPVNRVFKAILGVIWLAAVVGIFSGTTALSGELLNTGIGSRFDSWLFWRVALSVLGGGAALIGLLALLSTAVISPLSANRALPVRVFVTTVWLLTGAGVAIWSITLRNFAPVMAWAVLHILLCCSALFIAVSEREHLGQRVRLSIPREGVLRLLVFPFYSGAANGVVWSSIMILLTLLVAWGRSTFFSPHPLNEDDAAEFMAFITGLGLYAFSYALAASFIRRIFLANRVTSAYTWVIGLILLVVAATIIPLLLFLASGEWNEEWFIASPFGMFVGLTNSNNDVLWGSVVIAGISSFFAGILSLPWLIEQIADFSPPRPEATSEPQTKEPK
jgi:hypothetical protein